MENGTKLMAQLNGDTVNKWLKLISYAHTHTPPRSTIENVAGLQEIYQMNLQIGYPIGMLP